MFSGIFLYCFLAFIHLKFDSLNPILIANLHSENNYYIIQCNGIFPFSISFQLISKYGRKSVFALQTAFSIPKSGLAKEKSRK